MPLRRLAKHVPVTHLCQLTHSYLEPPRQLCFYDTTVVGRFKVLDISLTGRLFSEPFHPNQPFSVLSLRLYYSASPLCYSSLLLISSTSHLYISLASFNKLVP